VRAIRALQPARARQAPRSAKQNATKKTNFTAEGEHLDLLL
jgi:hypothetical protein